MATRPSGDPDQIRLAAQRLRVKSEALRADRATIEREAGSLPFTGPAGRRLAGRLHEARLAALHAESELRRAAHTLDQEAANLRLSQVSWDAEHTKATS